MSEENQYLRAAKAVVEAVGGKENISAATHCATRLRLVLVDEKKINKEIIDNEPMIKGNFLTAGQFQLIIGTGLVNKVYAELVNITGVKQVSKDEAKELAGAKGNIVQRFIKTLSDIFVPIIPAIVAGGLLMGLNNVLTAEWGADKTTLIKMFPSIAPLADMINTFANAPFVFLPILIAFSATRIFGGNPFLGAVLGMIMVHPALTNNYALSQAIADGTLQYWDLFGLHMAKAGYQGQVLPVLVGAWILAKLEVNIRKKMPASIDLLATPLLAIFITSFLMFACIGEWTRAGGEWFTSSIVNLYQSAGWLGGVILGLIYAPIVITGMHNSFIPVETQLIASRDTTGGTFIFPIAAMNNVAQGAAALAAIRTTNDEKLKGVASASGVSALLGITEPAMFGVNLRLRYPFYAALIGTSIAAGFISIFGTKAVALGAAGLLGVVSIDIKYLIYYIVGMAISFGITFTLTLAFAKIFGGDKAVKKEAPKAEVKAETKEEAPKVAQNANEIPAEWVNPIEGRVMPLAECPDQGFASGAMGAGYAIEPSGGKVKSPVNGTISTIFPTKHAIGITADNGVEILIHIGIDTVKLEGEGFKPLVKDGDKVKAGQEIMEVKWKKIKDKVPSIITPIIFTEWDDKIVVIENNLPSLKK